MIPFRIKPWYIGIFTSGRWVTTCPWINVPKGVDPLYYSWIVKHETVHLEQQKAVGFWKWLWKYYSNRAFRLDQEAAGAAAEYWELIAADRLPNQEWLDEYAKQYTNISYLWCAKSQEEGLAVLNQKIKDLAPAPVLTAKKVRKKKISSTE